MQKLKEIFIKYPSLRLSDTLNMDKMSTELLEQEYVGTEKLHGTNASIYVYPDGSYQIAGRKIFIQPTDKEHLVRNLVNDVDVDFFVQKGMEILERNEDFKFVIMVGEYFGSGIYQMKYQQVEDNTKEFRLFNIFGYKESFSVTEKDGTKTMAHKLTKLSYEEIVSTFPKEYTVPYEFVGKLTELLDKSDTTLDSNYGGDREGFVLQPSARFDFTTNTPYALHGIKVKADKFLEKARRTKKPRVKDSPQEISLKKATSEEEKELMEELFTYVTLNRLDNVISHGEIPTVSYQNINLMRDKLMEDIIKEFEFTETFTKEKVEKTLPKCTLVLFGLIKERISLEK